MSIHRSINVMSLPYTSFQQNDLKLLPGIYIKFEVFTVVKIDVVELWAVISYGLVCWFWSFGEIYCLLLQGKVNAVPLHEKQAQKGSRNIACPYSTPALEVCGWSTPRPGRSITGKGTHLIGGWASLAAGLDVSGRYRPQRIWNPCWGK
jgi:hypothetical protein